MNVIKEHKIANRKKGQVTFGAKHGGQWLFEVADRESGRWTKIMKVRGGLEVAEKIADTIHKSWLRTAGKKLQSHERIDATARRKIDLLVKIRTLKDYNDEPEWWSNRSTACPSVVMVDGHEQTEIPKGISAEDLAEDEVPVSREMEAELAQLG